MSDMFDRYVCSEVKKKKKTKKEIRGFSLISEVCEEKALEKVQRHKEISAVLFTGKMYSSVFFSISKMQS